MTNGSGGVESMVMEKAALVVRFPALSMALMTHWWMPSGKGAEGVAEGFAKPSRFSVSLIQSWYSWIPETGSEASCHVKTGDVFVVMLSSAGDVRVNDPGLVMSIFTVRVVSDARVFPRESSARMYQECVPSVSACSGVRVAVVVPTGI